MNRPPIRYFVSQSDFAKLRRVSRKSVTTWKQKGLLVMSKENLVDVAASETRLDVSKSLPPQPVTNPFGNTPGHGMRVTNLQARIRQARTVLAPDRKPAEVD